MIINEIQQFLFENKDEEYANFQIKLIPTINPESVIGVRTPILRNYAKELIKRDDIDCFLNDIPHRYHEENQLHVFVLSLYKDFEVLMPCVENFLKYIDNWATCDSFSPKIFKKHKSELLVYIKKWLKSSEIYTVRFGIGMLMGHYLGENFDIKYPDMVSELRSDEYYINMMIAWYFATALSKQYEDILPFIEDKKLDKWTHNKAIQKAIESYRISSEQKEYLKTLKVK